jgi:hypothetical protein
VIPSGKPGSSLTSTSFWPACMRPLHFITNETACSTLHVHLHGHLSVVLAGKCAICLGHGLTCFGREAKKGGSSIRCHG